MLGLSPLVLAMQLRTVFLAGTPAGEILQAAAKVGLHPLSIAVEKPYDDAITQRKLRREVLPEGREPGLGKAPRHR